MDIVKQLQEKNFRFILISPKDKKPLEQNWTKDANYVYNDQKIINHNGNLGILTGNGLIILDCDTQEMENLARSFGDTFVVGTSTTPEGYRKKHFYFLSKLEEKQILEYNGKHLGEIQAKGQQCIIPGSIHPSGAKYEVLEDNKIASISRDTVLSAITPFISHNKKLSPSSKREFKGENDPLIKEIKSKLTVFDVMEKYGFDMSKNPTKCLWHDSQGEKNFGYNNETWHCFSCNRAGSMFQLVMEHETCDFPTAKEKLLIMAGITKTETTEEPGSEYNPYEIKKLLFRTDHLPYFDSLDKIIALGGKDYAPIKKTLWYHIVGGILKLPIKIGDIETDTRINPLFLIDAGSGKKNLVEATKFSAITTNKTYMIPVSMHPEAVVGKKKVSKKGEVVELRGAFDEDFVIFDEAYELLQMKNDNHRQTLSYMRTALDPIGRNTIVKKMVDLQNKDILKYDANCSIMILSQPTMVSKMFINTGTFRRFLTPYMPLSPIPEDDVISILKNKIEGKDKTLEAKKEWSDFLKSISDRSGTFDIDPEAQDALLNCNREINSLMANWSQKGRRYGMMIRFSVTDIILKMSAIHCAINNRFSISLPDVQKAYMDFFENMCLSLRFITRNVYGNLEADEGYGGATGDDQECIEWLISEGATGEKETKVMIREYKEAISETCGLSSRGAEKRYIKHKRNGWVRTKKGRHTSIVWTDLKGIESTQSTIDTPPLSLFSGSLYSYTSSLKYGGYSGYSNNNIQKNDNIEKRTLGYLPSSSGLTVTSYSSIVNRESKKEHKKKGDGGGIYGTLGTLEVPTSISDYTTKILENIKKDPKSIIEILKYFRTLKNNSVYSDDKFYSFLSRLKHDGVIFEVTPGKFGVV